MRGNIVLVLSLLGTLAVNQALWAQEAPLEEAPRPMAIAFGFRAPTGKYNAGWALLPHSADQKMIPTPLGLFGEGGGASRLWINLKYSVINRRFLPGQDELASMDREARRTKFDDFEETWYWSQAQRNDNGAWGQPFGDGGQVILKVYADAIRAVKTF